MTDHISKLGFLAGATRFRRISERLHIDGDKIYKDHQVDFKASWFSTFYTLAKTDHPKTVLDIAGEIGYSHITVKNVIRELEANGLVKIKGHPTDKRSKQIALSAKGLTLLKKLEKIWLPFADTLKHLLDTGHPDFLNIIDRIETELYKHPINEKLKVLEELPQIRVLDYKPSLKKYFYDLAGNWLLEVLNGTLEEEDKFTLNNPDQSYLLQGGFVFYAVLDNKVVGCVALKRLDENTFEFAKLFIQKGTRNLGIATKLIDRCITRCKENAATQLWLQTTMRMPEAHKLYYKLGFDDKKAPKQMTVLKRTEKIMMMSL
jgi:DNA-binding MarR family transcriptional regulator/N-acetylglutamate synthase-like GNAT family acetyltransferase